MRKYAFAALLIPGIIAMAGMSIAAVSAKDANRLNSDLTPMGAERNGNKNGTIPEWNGGYTTPVLGATGKNVDPDPFSEDKPLFIIDASNAKEYEENLSAGTMELLKQYPDSFRLEIYKTRRTFAAPKWVYENTFKNATRANIVQDGLSIEGAYGGTPFPIPGTGLEVMWNHNLHLRPEEAHYTFRNYVGSSDGKRALASTADMNIAAPYYYKDGEKKWDGSYQRARAETVEPPFKAGELLIVVDSVDPKKSRQAWQYLVGQRRMRRAPTVGYDTPDFVASGANYFDEVKGLYGPLDRYDWKLVGKKEIYIPYNCNRLFNAKADDAFSEYHLNPNEVRWELHRVWVVEGNLAPDKRHVVPRRTYYLDEDSWAIALVDGYDAAGELWRTSQVFPLLQPSVPLTYPETTMVFNLQAKTYSVIQMLGNGFFEIVEPHPSSFYSADAVGSDGIR